MQVSKNNFERYAKQIMLKNIGINGQKKILNSKVLIIGLGGLGCPVSLYLTNSGVGTMGIVDNDKIEITNLNRQILFDQNDVGKNKITQAKLKLNRINNKIKIKTFQTKINKKNIKKICKEFDIICDGTDNFASRYLINDFCKKEKKILVTAAISKFYGHLFNFNFQKKRTPCFRCFMPSIPTVELNCDVEGIFSPVAGIMGVLQANEILKIILNIKSNLNGKFLNFDALKTSFREVKLSINKNCINKC